MKTLLNKKIIISMGLLATLFIRNSALAKTENPIKVQQDGMTFVVGKHEPEKRVNPKQDENKIIEKVIVKEKIIQTTNLEENNENSSEDLEKKQNMDFENEIDNAEDSKDNDKSIFKVIQEKLSAIEKAIEDILQKLGILEESAKNVDKLIETTSDLTDEVTKQDKRINELEDKLLKEETESPDENN